MPANIEAVWPRQGQAEWDVISAANTAKDGTGIVVTVFTADPAEGSRCEKIIIVPKGTNVATVIRVFLNNGADPSVAANNMMIAQKTLPLTTNSEVAALAAVEIDIASLISFIPPGYKLNIALGTAVAAGFAVTATGGRF